MKQLPEKPEVAEQKEAEKVARSGEGPDPVVGAGVTLLGIFIMGAGGARDLHYVFDVGVLVAVVGAGAFVLAIALSAMKQRKAETEAQPSETAEEGHASPVTESS